MNDAVSKRIVPSTDGALLEVLIEQPTDRPSSDVLGTIVVCHPHPQQGGTMRAPILGAIAKAILDRGLNVVRFNFRGVGESTGRHDDGIGEVSDVAAIADFVEREFAPLIGITGWSFGAATALVWQARSGSTIPYVGIAPPIKSPLSPPLPEPDELAPARRRFIAAERDQFVSLDELVVYAARIQADVEVYKGSDHFFVFKHDRIAEDALNHIVGIDAGDTDEQ